jgi:anti-anti-sigma regulatory factor
MGIANHLADVEPGTDRRIMRPFTVIVEHGSGATRLRVAGVLDDDTVATFRRRLLELFALPVEAVTVDLSEVTTISFAALDALAEARAAAADRHIALGLVGITSD